MRPLGILGGGQLARMTVEAASALGIDVAIAERFADSPAARVTSASLVFPNGWDDAGRLDKLAGLAETVTLENEFVDAGVLRELEGRGARVLPSPACVGVVQDKLLQKRALALAELPVPRFREVADPAGLIDVGRELGWPLMLKARRDGYDGRGNRMVDSPQQAERACAELGWPERALMAEARVEFQCELACLVVRGRDGQVVLYPVVETRQDPALHVCREVLAPAPVAPEVASQAAGVARGAVEAVGGVGAFGVEMFLMHGDRVTINELAPRPHNSAHYTIEACWTSQFQNHVRAVMGLPVGDPRLKVPAAAMVNLLGTSTRPLMPGDLSAAFAASPRAYVHLYGKLDNRLGRKMGHVTALGASAGEALDDARAVARRIPV